MTDRARISYVGVVLAFGTLVSLSAISPYLFRILDMLRSQVPEPTATLLSLLLPLLVLSALFGTVR
jgi:hypothetical protein